MARPVVALTIPQPCQQSWAAMTPTGQGRHCAACHKTVVDWSAKTDAEILALLHAAAGSQCVRVRPSQLDRPLRPLAVPPAGHWRAWLAAAAAVWGLHETTAPPQATAQTTTQPPAYPANSPLNYAARPDYEGPAPTPVLHGRVTDASTNEGLPGATVLIVGTTIGTSTNANGTYSLPVPPALLTAHSVSLQLSSVGFETQQRQVAVNGLCPENFELAVQYSQLTGDIVVYRKGWPWHPRAIYYRTKYWLARTFRHREAD